ncbi:hypothetical protein DFH08DRAFT_1081080 [Mycena albidolilacea]|uniref:Uncharacterized protein n=1 Tax=Mycena albidolilacea TaxID=1033008 RepID=A0AAD6ZYT8_9AGAR|nr:hypothetical protein DFH08DRAFT_1081080 [Mycena albidolilacea]
MSISSTTSSSPLSNISALDSDAIASFVACSRCVLTRLTLLNSFVPPDEWSTLLPVAETVPTLELIGIFFIEGGDRLLPPNSPLPRLKVLSIVAYEFGRILDQFLESLDAQPTLHCAHLRIISQDRRPNPVSPPGAEVIAALGYLSAAGMRTTLETPTYQWPEDSRNDLHGGKCGLSLIY